MANPLSAVERGLLKSIEKLEKRNDDLEERIKALEEQMDQLYEERRNSRDDGK